MRVLSASFYGLALCLLSGNRVFADTALPLGIIGGSGSNGSYAAFVLPNSDKVASISDLPPYSAINGVAINQSGLGIVVDNQWYVAYVPPGTTTPEPISNTTLYSGDFKSLTVNNPGSALLKELFNFHSGNIATLAFNNRGVGLVGADPFREFSTAFLIQPTPYLNTVKVFDLQVHTDIYGVAVNESGKGIIGGLGYAAIVTPNQSVQALPVNPDVIISTVAINQLGKGVIGGVEPAPYVGLVAVDNTITSVLDLPVTGFINSVAINDLGTALIGGGDTSQNLLYAALVQNGSNHAVTLAGLPPLVAPGDGINSVALNNMGIGLIGGASDSVAFAALVAPNGALTPLTGLDVSSPSAIYSVALANMNVDPTFMGNYQNVINSQLAAANALESHLIDVGQWVSVPCRIIECAPPSPPCGNTPPGFPYCNDIQCEPCRPNGFTVWGAPFGNFVRQERQAENPSYNNWIGGALLGCDYQYDRFLVGGCLGYSYNDVHYGIKRNKTAIHEELAAIYGAYSADRVWVNGALWGGGYQLYNRRDTLSFITSRGNTYGWLFTPHLELVIRNAKKLDVMQPFVRADFVNTWQHRFTETGVSGLNLVMKDLYASLLRSEVGFRFYEQLSCCGAAFELEQKLSYVSRCPVTVPRVAAGFIASPITFPIAIGSRKPQHLVGGELRASYRSTQNLYFTLDLQAEAGKHFQSYFATLECGKSF